MSVRGVGCVVWDLSPWPVVSPGAGVKVGKLGWLEVPSSPLSPSHNPGKVVTDGSVRSL